MQRSSLLAALLCALSLGACGGDDAVDPSQPSATKGAPSVSVTALVPSPVASPSPVATPVITPTVQPSPTVPATPTPAKTIEPTATATGTPVVATAPPEPAPTTQPSFPTAATIEMVGFQKFFFVPEHVEIAAGGSATFVWVQGAHNVVSTGALAFADHPQVSSGGTFTATFSGAGTYAFTCQVHPDTMNGSVTVH